MNMESQNPLNRQSPEAQKAREARDNARSSGAHEKAQSQFERQMRRDARDQGEDPGLYSHGAIMSRSANDATNEHLAEERNKRRSILARLLGRGKVTGMDMMRDEADRVNELVDLRVDRDGGDTTHQEAADDIVGGREFNTHSSTLDRSGVYIDRADFVERLRADNPDIELRADQGDFGPAVESVQKVTQGMPYREARVYEDGLAKFIGNKMDTFIRTRNADTLRRIVLNNDLRHIPTDIIASLPEEVLSDPEVRQKLEAR